MGSWEAEVGRVREKKKRSEKRKGRKTKIQVEKLQVTVFFDCFGVPGTDPCVEIKMQNYMPLTCQ